MTAYNFKPLYLFMACLPILSQYPLITKLRTKKKYTAFPPLHSLSRRAKSGIFLRVRIYWRWGYGIGWAYPAVVSVIHKKMSIKGQDELRKRKIFVIPVDFSFAPPLTLIFLWILVLTSRCKPF